MNYVKGENSIPIMTIHKSKGLEYHTVIFIGLEDSAFWSFSSQEEEDTCAFFVALSRAKKRVLITFSNERDVGRNSNQFNQNVIKFHELLEKSGIVRIVDKRVGAT